MFSITILAAVVVQVQFFSCWAFITHIPSETVYTHYHGLNDYHNALKREAVHNYHPTRHTVWKSYFGPVMTNNGYMRPIKANCETELIYEKKFVHPPNPRKGGEAPPNNHWAPMPRPIIINPEPCNACHKDVVKVDKNSLAEAIHLANFLYQNEPITLKTEEIVSKGPGLKKKSPPEVIVSVNVGDKKIKEFQNPGNIKNMVPEKFNNKMENIIEKHKEMKKPHIRKNLPILSSEEPEEEVPESPTRNENDVYLYPEKLLKDHRIQFKETRLSDHDTIVEVVVPYPKKQKMCCEDEDEENDDKDESDESEDKNQEGDASCECSQQDPCLRPIVKNRFVILHLRDGDCVIQDPLIKMLAKV